MQDEVVVTRAYKRRECWFVEGRVLKKDRWLKAAFTVVAADVEHLSRDEFQEFARRQLPEVTEDKSWDVS